MSWGKICISTSKICGKCFCYIVHCIDQKSRSHNSNTHFHTFCRACCKRWLFCFLMYVFESALYKNHQNTDLLSVWRCNRSSRCWHQYKSICPLRFGSCYIIRLGHKKQIDTCTREFPWAAEQLQMCKSPLHVLGQSPPFDRSTISSHCSGKQLAAHLKAALYFHQRQINKLVINS